MNKKKQKWSKNAKEKMEMLGRFQPTEGNVYVTGVGYDFEEGERYCRSWNAEYLREIAAACLEVAQGLEESK